MSRISNIKIVKSGKITADLWNYDRETKIGETQRDVDITDRAMFHMMDECKIEENVVFEDVLLLINNINEYSALSPIFTRGPWLNEMVTEGLSIQDADKTLDTIRLGWASSVDNDFYNEGKDILDLYIDVVGLSESSNERFALDFTPLYKLAKCKIILDEELVITEERSEKLKQTLFEPVLLKTNKHFTLFNILRGLFWELSFHGSPSDRNKKQDDLMETMRKIDSGEEKTIPWEEVKERLNSKKNKL